MKADVDAAPAQRGQSDETVFARGLLDLLGHFRLHDAARRCGEAVGARAHGVVRLDGDHDIAEMELAVLHRHDELDDPIGRVNVLARRVQDRVGGFAPGFPVRDVVCGGLFLCGGRGV